MLTNNLKKRCLLIVPRSFYSYSSYIQKQLSSLGYDVTTSNDEYPENVLGKIMGKLHIPILKLITEKVITKGFLNENKYDIILIVKGRGMSKGLIEKLNKISPKIVGYNFDSFEYNKAPLKWLKYITKYCTFDYRDAEKYNLSIVELFSSLPENQIPIIFKYDVSAIVRNHSKRLKYIDTVFSYLPVENKFIYIFEQNIFTFILNFLRNPVLYLKYKKLIYFKPLPYQHYTTILEASNFTVDFAHPNQSGITIRCFEALSAQTKIITNNPFVLRNKHFNDLNTIVFNNTSSPYLLKKQFDKIKRHLPAKYKRTISDFVTDLIS
jgi:hypothetical protein